MRGETRSAEMQFFPSTTSFCVWWQLIFVPWSSCHLTHCLAALLRQQYPLTSSPVLGVSVGINSALPAEAFAPTSDAPSANTEQRPTLF